MAGEELVAHYEALMDRLPSEGLAAARARTLVSRLISIVEDSSDLIKKATCVAERSADCNPREDRPCNTRCATLWVAPSGIWRYKRPFTILFRDGTLRVIGKDVGVTLYRDRVEAMLPAGEQFMTIEVSLDSLEKIISEYQTLIYILRKVERPIRIAKEDLEKCSKERQLAC